MLWEEQIAERRLRGQSAIRRILAKPAVPPWGDYRIAAGSGQAYRVALRGPGAFDNYCSCPDFARNTLGTCKHIEGLLQRLSKRHGKRLAHGGFGRRRASLSLEYGETLRLRLRLPEQPSTGLRQLASRYFDADGYWRAGDWQPFPAMLQALQEADEAAVVYSDALEFVSRETERAEGLEEERTLLAACERGRDPLQGLLKQRLLPYQVRGAIFASCRGRVILADDMGLGKTAQAIAAAERLAQRRGIERVLVIAPASVKYQWKGEVEKFCGRSVQIVDGLMRQRRKLYAAPAFFNLASYEQVRLDLNAIREMRPDLVVLDEAQRIRNWATKTARAVKQIQSRYALVLTGTPLENKIEELYSVVEFIDNRRLGPVFRFLREHRVETPTKKLLGYRGLDAVRRKLEPVLLRRTRSEVLAQLPERTDQVFHVEMSREQAGPYQEQGLIVAQLVHKWQRQSWLSEIDLRRLTCALQNMRMLCNSTWLYDGETNISPKLREFRDIVRELALEEKRKVVVFSEYERMTRLAGEELQRLGIGFVSLSGLVPARQRGRLIERFRSEPECQVFLSTDAGGVGLNLQAASAVINFEPPWNPARLEQRIARVHRLGQFQPVQVIHLLTDASIETRIWELLKLKQALFAGVFDGGADTVDFAELGKRSMLEEIQTLLPPPAAAATAAEHTPKSAGAEAAGLPGKQSAGPDMAAPSRPATTAGAAPTAVPAAPVPAATGAPALLQSAVQLLESLPNCIVTDPKSGANSLSIPLPPELTPQRLGAALANFGAFLRQLAASAGSAGG